MPPVSHSRWCKRCGRGINKHTRGRIRDLCLDARAERVEEIFDRLDDRRGPPAHAETDGR